MRCFSLFTGVGGFEQGFPKGWELVGFSETDKYASQVLKYHYPNVKNYGNCEQIKWGGVPDFVLLTGGSPCQNFSIAGKRAGIVGEQSRLVWEFIRCLHEKKPRYFIWENVKGALSSRRGWDFANILTAFSAEGYSLWWQVLNAKDFGVPQNRERIFVIGFREGSPKEVFFEREDSEATDEQGGNELGEQVANTLRTNYSNGRSNETYIQVQNPGASQYCRVYGQDGLAPTLQSQSGMSSQKHPFIVAQRGRNPQNPKSRKSGLPTEQMLEPNLNGISNALTSVEKDNYIFDGAVRKLMPLECERLMGWKGTDFYVKMGLCEDLVKNYVDAVLKNPKLQKLVLSVEKRENREFAKVVRSVFYSSHPKIKSSVQENVISISAKGKTFGKKQIELQQNVENAVKKEQKENLKQKDSARLDAFIGITEGRITTIGKEELQVREQSLIHQENGKNVLELFGNEIMQLAEGVEKNLYTELNNNFIFTTSFRSDIRIIDIGLITLYFFARNAIGGHIQEKISKKNIFLNLRIFNGWTKYGINEKGEKVEISDSQRYKMCGNGVVSNVVRAVIRNVLL